MSRSVRQVRIERATNLAVDHQGSAEMLGFLVEVMRFGDELQVTLEDMKIRNGKHGFQEPIAPGITAKFSGFLKMVEAKGPETLACEAQRTGNLSDTEHCELLNSFWARRDATALVGRKEFLARAFLQPYAEFIRSRSGKQKTEWTPRVCPFCLRKPGSGVLRPLGDGGQRFLVCSFCLGEWEFRRIVCPACGEENELKLPVYVAEEFSHVRVECCDSCRCYMKTVDLTRNGLADPVVDEIAAIPLDLWAQEKGYSKLQTNLMML